MEAVVGFGQPFLPIAHDCLTMGVVGFADRVES